MASAAEPISRHEREIKMEKLTLKTIFEALANVNAGNAYMGEPVYELTPLVSMRKEFENGDCIYSYGGKPVSFLNDLIDRLREVLHEDEIERLLSLTYEVTEWGMIGGGLQKVFFAIDNSNPKFMISLHLKMEKVEKPC